MISVHTVESVNKDGQVERFDRLEAPGVPLDPGPELGPDLGVGEHPLRRLLHALRGDHSRVDPAVGVEPVRRDVHVVEAVPGLGILLPIALWCKSI